MYQGNLTIQPDPSTQTVGRALRRFVRAAFDLLAFLYVHAVLLVVIGLLIFGVAYGLGIVLSFVLALLGYSVSAKAFATLICIALGIQEVTK